MREPHISIIVEYEVDEDRLPEFMAALKDNCRKTLADDGCLRMEVSQPVEGGPGAVFLNERWRDQAAIEAHRAQRGHDDQHVRVDALVTAKRVVKGTIVEFE